MPVCAPPMATLPAATRAPRRRQSRQRQRRIEARQVREARREADHRHACSRRRRDARSAAAASVAVPPPRSPGPGRTRRRRRPGSRPVACRAGTVGNDRRRLDAIASSSSWTRAGSAPRSKNTPRLANAGTRSRSQAGACARMLRGDRMDVGIELRIEAIAEAQQPGVVGQGFDVAVGRCAHRCVRRVLGQVALRSRATTMRATRASGV